MALPGPCSESLLGHHNGATVPPQHRPVAPRKGSVPGLAPVPSTALLVTSSSTGNAAEGSGTWGEGLSGKAGHCQHLFAFNYLQSSKECVSA